MPRLCSARDSVCLGKGSMLNVAIRMVVSSFLICMHGLHATRMQSFMHARSDAHCLGPPPSGMAVCSL